MVTPGEHMELICPSCEARYGIPDGSIGEKGRQVSCMNCGHGWHAFPPLVLGAAQAAGSPSAGMQWRDPAASPATPSWQDNAAQAQPPVSPGGFAAATGSLGAAGSDAVAASAQRSAASRSEQLMEIRETLAEIQSEDRANATQAPASHDAVPPAEDRIRAEPRLDDNFGRSDLDAPDTRETTQLYSETSDYRAEDPVEESNGEVDLLRRRMEQSEAREKPKPADVKRLRKKHDRKVRRQHSNSAAGSGAFLTGFLLVAIIASVMIALYLLAPQIIERMPAAEQPMNEYVATIDGLRVSIAETYQGIAGWVSESLEGKV